MPRKKPKMAKHPWDDYAPSAEAIAKARSLNNAIKRAFAPKKKHGSKYRNESKMSKVPEWEDWKNAQKNKKEIRKQKIEEGKNIIKSSPLMKLVFLDTETTGVKKDSRMIQLAYSVYGEDEVFCEMYKAPVEIEVGAMVATGITPIDIRDKNFFSHTSDGKKLQDVLDINVLVAHNAKFDLGILKKEGLDVEQLYSICTLKVARFLYPDVQRHALQYLRYHFEHYELDFKAHDAEGDVRLLKLIFFKHLFKDLGEYMSTDDEKSILMKMIDITENPALLTKFKFGQYRDESFDKIAKTDKGLDYMRWLSGDIKKKPESEQDENLLYTLEYHINRNST